MHSDFRFQILIYPMHLGQEGFGVKLSTSFFFNVVKGTHNSYTQKKNSIKYNYFEGIRGIERKKMKWNDKVFFYVWIEG